MESGQGWQKREIFLELKVGRIRTLAIIYQLLACYARHRSEHVTCIISFNPHISLMRWGLLLSPF